MTTKRKNIKNNKTRKTKKVYILKEKEKSINQIIIETKQKQIYDKIFKTMENFFLIPNTKKAEYLSKNDFYNYINQMWIKDITASKEEMKYLIELDDFRILQYKVFNKLDDIVKKYIVKNNTIVSTELKNFYRSSIKFNSVISSKNYLKKTIDYIDTLRKDKNNLWKMLAFINKNEFYNSFGPISWSFLPDKKNSSEYVNYINPHTFAVFDLSVYEDSSYTQEERNTYAKKYSKFFIKYLNSIFRIALPDDKSLNPHDVLDIGKLLYSFFGKFDKNIIESEDYYNKITSEEALNKYKFNWVEYCKELGYYNNKIPDFFIVANLNYFKFCVEELIDNWNTEKWRSYWIWIITRTVIRLTANWHKYFYSFYGKKTQGILQAIRENEEQAAIITTTIAFNPLLNNEYIDNVYNEENIVYATNMANDIRNILINKLHRNTWLQEKTKNYAIFKVEKINMEIGSKKFIDNYEKILPLLNFNPNEFLDNILKICDWRHKLYIDGKIDIIKTLTTYDYNAYPLKITNIPSYIVNAQYLENENTIKVSSAYLQKPFINVLEQGTEYNLAYLGFTLAHEFSHSLDNIGSKYDVNGNLYDWWSKKDKIKYKQIQDNVIKQYYVFSKYDGLSYNPSYSIGEDIADIVGLNVSEEYLSDFCIKNAYTPYITYLHFKMFYVYFTYEMRQKIRPQSIRYELITNVHPIDKYRANVTLSRSALFKSMFNIKKGDKMFWNDKYNNIWD